MELCLFIVFQIFDSANGYFGIRQFFTLELCMQIIATLRIQQSKCKQFCVNSSLTSILLKVQRLSENSFSVFKHYVLF